MQLPKFLWGVALLYLLDVARNLGRLLGECTNCFLMRSQKALLKK